MRIEQLRAVTYRKNQPVSTNVEIPDIDDNRTDPYKSVEVAAIMGWKMTKFYSRIRKGSFPRGKTTPGKASRWQCDEVHRLARAQQQTEACN